ncbi:MAG: clostripain-related cysteine peptidase [Prevotellaceae bacterium]|nr:clostripain-related cysteine peptidase [Prevotellaceae bacterium]
MKRLLPLLAALLLASCSDTLTLPDSGARRTVIVYMMGENSLTQYAQGDLNEMRSATSLIPDSCRLVVFFDNSRSDINPEILCLTKDKGESLQFEYPEDVVSTDSATMLGALRYMIEANPSDEYALVLWSHGSGWIPASASNGSSRTIGIDNGENTSSNTGQQMSIPTLRHVLEQAGAHWQYILYDACFMQCVEVAYELRELTDWSIGTPAETPANGAAYDKLMPFLFEAEGYPKDIAEQYYEEYADNYGVIISAIRSSSLPLLATRTAALLSPLESFPLDGLQQYCAYASQTGWKPEYYDIGSCMGAWLEEEAFQQWLSALDEAVPYRYLSPSWVTSYSSVFRPRLTDQEHSVAVSMYVPQEGRDDYNAAWRQYEWYRDAAHQLDL